MAWSVRKPSVPNGQYGFQGLMFCLCSIQTWGLSLYGLVMTQKLFFKWTVIYRMAWLCFQILKTFPLIHLPGAAKVSVCVRDTSGVIKYPLSQGQSGNTACKTIYHRDFFCYGTHSKLAVFWVIQQMIQMTWLNEVHAAFKIHKGLLHFVSSS